MKDTKRPDTSPIPDRELPAFLDWVVSEYERANAVGVPYETIREVAAQLAGRRNINSYVLAKMVIELLDLNDPSDHTTGPLYAVWVCSGMPGYAHGTPGSGDDLGAHPRATDPGIPA